MDLLEGEISGGDDNGVRVYEANLRLRAMASKPEVEMISVVSLLRMAKEGMQTREEIKGR
ncbi:hypothetical protein SESBI_03724 [Sesbania bispinosa]|nr:hypothetical protein SESBI_03724 [Sesbania bispinosa]